MKEIFENEIKELFSIELIKSSITYRVVEIEPDLNEYCLTLRFGCKYLLKGIYIETGKNVILNSILTNCTFVLNKKNSFLKIYLKDWTAEKGLLFENKKSITNIYNVNSNDDIFSLFHSLNLLQNEFIKEDVFLIHKIADSYKIKNVINSNKYIIEKSELKNTKNIKDLILDGFIYIKYFSIVNNEKIKLNKFSIIQRPSDYQLFKLLDTQISNEEIQNDFYEIMPISNKYKIELTFLFSKVILKNKREEYIIIIDKFKRIIRYKSKYTKNIDLFDLIFITKCTIEKIDEYVYDLKTYTGTIFYFTKKLIFNKEISINNFTVLDIYFPDYKSINHYNELRICERNVPIKKERQIYLFKFENLPFNEFVPFVTQCKGKDGIYTFKFFLMHNLLNKINIFINYKGINKCAIDYCYYNVHTDNDIPENIVQTIDSNSYKISQSNNFDSFNRISFIVLNVPQNESTDKIKIHTKKKIISTQLWFTAFNEKEKLTYYLTQILDIDEANTKIYYRYNLNKFEFFENFYINILNFYKGWKKEKEKNIYQYFENFSKETENSKNDIESLNDKYNVDYEPDSADYSIFKIYASISLFQTFQKIKENYVNDFDNLLIQWKIFFTNYYELINVINDISNDFTNHQKIRIIDAYIHKYFSKEQEFNFPCKFWYVNSSLNSPSNSYSLAISFNKNIIKNLNEKSALTTAYLQLDSFIMTNYFIEDKLKTYSLSNEPLILMKYHLLISYEDFLFIYFEPPNQDIHVKASHNISNRVTLINERVLFDSNHSENFVGKDHALPISMECFHEKDSHGKKNLKNLRIESPIICYRREFGCSVQLKQSEDGKFLESLIGNEDFIDELKNAKNKLGELMEIKYFIDKDFTKLHEKYNELMNKKKSEEKVDEKNSELDSKKEKQLIVRKNKNELKTLDDFEKYYLINGIFIYPDSLPSGEFPINCKPPTITQGEKDYLNKYKLAIEKGKKLHLTY